jgi:hypothetical protein
LVTKGEKIYETPYFPNNPAISGDFPDLQSLSRVFFFVKLLATVSRAIFN